MMRHITGLLTSGALLLAAPLAAQEHRAWPNRVFVTIDVPFQPLSNDFSESVSVADTLRKSENDTFVAGYESTRGALVDAGAAVHVAGNFGVGITASLFKHAGPGSFGLTVPNPLAANRPLGVAGSVSELNRREVGIHIQALYGLALSKGTRLIVSGGPSIFNTKQDVVRSIEFDTAPGFTALSFEQALVVPVERTALGFNVGADVTWALASHLGIGAVTRYSRARVRLQPGSESGVDRAIDVYAGGLQVGGGIRLMF